MTNRMKIKYALILATGIVLGFLVTQAVLSMKNAATQHALNQNPPDQKTQELKQTRDGATEPPYAPGQTQAYGQTQPAIQTQSTALEEQQQTQNNDVSVKSKFFEAVENVSADDDPYLGSKTAKLEIVEFTDYQCTYCKKYFEDSFPLIKKNYIDTGKVKYVVRDFPLEEHPQALLAAKTAACAGKQGKYWEMHDMLFYNQSSWSGSPDAQQTFLSYAGTLQLNQDAFKKCLNDKSTEDEIAKDVKDAATYGVSKTPTIFIGGEKITGAQPFETTFKTVIDRKLT